MIIQIHVSVIVFYLLLCKDFNYNQLWNVYKYTICGVLLYSSILPLRNTTGSMLLNFPELSNATMHTHPSPESWIVHYKSLIQAVFTVHTMLVPINFNTLESQKEKEKIHIC